jgi:hypothetical protein
MQSKNIIESLIEFHNSNAQEDSKIKLEVSKNSISLDLGYSVFLEQSNHGITDNEYEKLLDNFLNALLSGFKQSCELRKLKRDAK